MSLSGCPLWAHSPYGTHLPSEVTKDVYFKSISKVAVDGGLWSHEGKYRGGNWAVVQKDSRNGYRSGWIDLEDITKMQIPKGESNCNLRKSWGCNWICYPVWLSE